MKKQNFKDTEIATALDLPVGTIHKILKQLQNKKSIEDVVEENVVAASDTETVYIIPIERNKYIIIDISGSLIIKHLKSFKEELHKILESGDIRPVALRLTEINRIDSSAVGVIVNFNKNMLKKGRKVFFLDPSTEIDPILRQLNIYETIPVVGTELILEQKLKEFFDERSRKSRLGGF